MKRLEYISLMRALSIIAVVIFHVYGYMYAAHFPDSRDVYQQTYYWFNQCFIINIAMPVFTFISGFLFNYLYSKGGKYRDFIPFAKNKILRLLLPFWVFGLIMMLTTNSLNLYSLFIEGTFWHLWYLPLLFWCFIISWLILKFIRIPLIKLLIFPIFWLIPLLKIEQPMILGTHNILEWYWIFYFGIIVADFEDKIFKYIHKFYLWIPMLLIYLFVTFQQPTEYGEVTLRYLLFTPLVLLSSWFIFSQIRNFDNIVCKVLLNISKYSFGIYIFHNWIGLYCVSRTAKNLLPLSELAMDHIILFPLVLTVVVFGLSYLLTFMLQKTKVGRLLLG